MRSIFSRSATLARFYRLERNDELWERMSRLVQEQLANPLCSHVVIEQDDDSDEPAGHMGEPFRLRASYWDDGDG